MKLSKIIAQKIVEEMMDVLPYNINVMNDEGIIIGSGEKNRIGRIHEASVEVIRKKQSVEILEESEMVKPGINEPLIMNGEVIGITGDPEVVRPFGKLVRVTAALLIEQSKADEDKHNKRLNRQKFYLELSQKKSYDERFKERAKSYQMDLNKQCRGVIIEGELGWTVRHPHQVEVNNKTILFFTDAAAYEAFLEEVSHSQTEVRIGIGLEEKVMAQSMQQAEAALAIGVKLFPGRTLYPYEEFRILIGATHTKQEYFVEIINRLDKAELVQTLQAYIEENGDINKVALRLNIHRNTLTYRLERIRQLTGRNPKNLVQLFELLCGLAWR